ncbi:MAG: helix-turn-helix transcriptional regulator [Lachnospiraceae bacterium]|nr:helix-turn-helix transcriptional regulator [Lachnospiraceae bacterium]
MNKNNKNYYRKLFERSNFRPCKAPKGFPPGGDCYEFAPEYGNGYYWYYDKSEQYNIKIHDFYFNEDTMLNMDLPECLSVTWYDSISGEEFNPYRNLNCKVIRSFLGGYEPYRALIHRNIPVRSIGIEYRPDFFHQVLKESFGDSYEDPKTAFNAIDETADFPEMKKLLWDIWKYEGSASSAPLYYDAKIREALALVFERHKTINKKTKTALSPKDTELLNSLGLYINDHYADHLSIESLAKIACMGTTKLKNTFKDYYGMTIADYIQKVRIDHAEHLLAYTSLPVSEVANAVGYVSPGHFAELFSSAKGLLPLAYRKAFRKNE